MAVPRVEEALPSHRSADPTGRFRRGGRLEETHHGLGYVIPDARHHRGRTPMETLHLLRDERENRKSLIPPTFSLANEKKNAV